ncbi:MAG: tRNA nucleotidyltransferase (CCA-adding enzyme) [Gammaproteobacteria bacterium]|jgi:tRNA nucleotidyltransferase (CCA-adding enzyme)
MSQAYLVGGAVRDRLLNRPVTESDWVVVGATPEEMRDKGFKAVGTDFPVFLHPETHEEYALARTERKSGVGYKGFSFHADPSVTLEDDLVRRDFTVNAMAQTDSGDIIDPYNGQADIEAKLFRHVSDAFVEDPVRILRAARFMARYWGLGFRIAPETLELMKSLVDSGEIDHLVPERVWKELQRALGEPHPQAFISTLRDCGALARLLPEVDALFGVPQTAKWHPEIDTGIHILMALKQSAEITDSPRTRFAVLLHDLGKGVTPSEVLPGHRGHENAGVPLVEAVCDRLKVPNDYRRLAIKVCRWHLHTHKAEELRSTTVLKLLEGLDGIRRDDDIEPFLLACESDARGRKGLKEQHYPQPDVLRQLFAAAKKVTSRDLDLAGLKGEKIAEKIRQARIAAIDAAR